MLYFRILVWPLVGSKSLMNSTETEFGSLLEHEHILSSFSLPPPFLIKKILTPSRLLRCSVGEMFPIHSPPPKFLLNLFRFIL